VAYFDQIALPENRGSYSVIGAGLGEKISRG
jgi:hypothetical protein